MRSGNSHRGQQLLTALMFVSIFSGGCMSVKPTIHGIEPAPYVTANTSHGSTSFADPRYEHTLPRELQKTTMPEYIIEPPDFLRIDLLRVSPNTKYKLESQDVVLVQLTYPSQTEPFTGEALIGPDGQINLGPTFGGMVKLKGLTIEQAREAIEKQALAANVKSPKAQLSLVQSRSLSQLRGEYLVRPDGTIGLGTYGNIRVVGMTLQMAKAEIEKHLSQFIDSPEIAIDVAAYNSKIYYVIYDGGGRGQLVTRLPITGNDTILDAVSQMNGLSPVSSEHHIWIARPSPAVMNQDIILPVDWIGITTRGRTATNYQLLPGDRIYVKANPLIEADNWLGMIVSPIERLFGVTLLGQTTIQALNNPSSVGGGVGTGR